MPTIVTAIAALAAALGLLAVAASVRSSQISEAERVVERYRQTEGL